MPDIERRSLSVVVPCYNEGKNLSLVLEHFTRPLKKRTDVELILVNNGSQDNSHDILAAYVSSGGIRNLKVVELEHNQGYGGGILAGLAEASGKYLGWTHADLQTDPEDVFKAWDVLSSKAEGLKVLVKGRRSGRGAAESLLSFMMGVVASLALKQKLQDINAQPKLFPRELYQKMVSPPRDFSLDLYLLYLANIEGYQILNIPVLFRKRQQGEAKGGGSWATRSRLIRRTWQYIFELSSKLQKEQHA